MNKKNILIIDDSALMRRVLSDIINSDQRFTVADVAVNGLDGLSVLQMHNNNFDAILLDINMPKMNGIEFLAELKRQNIKVTVIVVSTITKKDANETIQALELGAFDFVTKPESYIEVKSNAFVNKLLKCISAATKAESVAENKIETNSKEAVQKKQQNSVSTGSKKLVALACSTGGPRALHTVIPSLPKNLDASVLVVQHMPEGFTKSLAVRLNEISNITVKEAEHGEILQKGVVYIAKGGTQLRLVNNNDNTYQLSVTVEPARHGLLPCADIMYESLLDTDFDRITCVVLTGMGGDGTAGIKQLNLKKNIYVIAQNEETSTVYGMPKVIRDAGLVDEVVALNEVSDAIIKNVGVY